MDPITLAIIMFVVSFLLAKKAGLSNTSAALAATGVAAGSYFLASSFQGNDAAATPGATPTTSSGFGTIGTAVSGVGNWIAANPGTTAALVGTAAVASSSTFMKFLPWVALGVGALLIAGK